MSELDEGRNVFIASCCKLLKIDCPDWNFICAEMAQSILKIVQMSHSLHCKFWNSITSCNFCLSYIFGIHNSWLRQFRISNKDSIFTVLVLRMAHRKWIESEQQPGTAGPGNMLGCCFNYFHFLWAILSTSTVLGRILLKPARKDMSFLLFFSALDTCAPRAHHLACADGFGRRHHCRCPTSPKRISFVKPHLWKDSKLRSLQWLRGLLHTDQPLQIAP